MEQRLSLSVLVASPIILPLSFVVKSKYCSVMPAVVLSILFLFISFLARQVVSSRVSIERPLWGKFLCVGFYVGLQVSVFLEVENFTVSYLLVMANMSSVFFAVLLTVMPLRETVLLKYPHVFTHRTTTTKWLVIDTVATMMLSEGLGYFLTIYLSMGYLSTSWFYSNIYTYGLYIIGTVVALALVSKPVVLYIMKRKKPKVF